MSTYESAAQMFAVIGTAWRRAFEDPGTRERFVALEIFVRFRIQEPAGELWLLRDGTVHEGPWAGTPDRSVILMEMKGDVAHRFWCDALNVPLAAARGEIKAKGPVTKIFGLIPLVKPVKALYPALCAAHGVGRG